MTLEHLIPFTDGRLFFYSFLRVKVEHRGHTVTKAMYQDMQRDCEGLSSDDISAFFNSSARGEFLEL